jgi:hypothetical protein
MDSDHAREIYKKYAASVVYVAVESDDGTQGIGSAFHVGDGVFVTAKHVVEGKRIVEVGITEQVHIKLSGREAETARSHVVIGDADPIAVHAIFPGTIPVTWGPYGHRDSQFDIAVFGADVDEKLPAIPLGGHLDDWISPDGFLLSDALVMGYPPIPTTSGPYLVAAKAEVNSVIDPRDVRTVHFVLSAAPRGGFSGGVAFSEWDFALGMITRSLILNDGLENLGYMSVISVEQIWVCLAQHDCIPDAQGEGWKPSDWLDWKHLFTSLHPEV